VVSKRKGNLINKDEWGKRKLAYPIQKFEEAFYVLFHYEGESEIADELERLFKQSDTILRYLTVKKETRENVRGRKKRAPVKAEEPPPKEEFPPEEGPPPEALPPEAPREEEAVVESTETPADKPVEKEEE
jgi:small subunit ribosomal protein S6